MQDPLQLFNTIIAIAGGMSVGAAIIFSARQRSYITLLKDENATLVGINTRQDKEISVLKTQNSALETERNIWMNNVTQAPSIKELATVTAQQHQEVIVSLANVVTGLSDVAKELRRDRGTR